MAKSLSIGTVAKRTGVQVSALRFYEEKGLLAAARTASGQRRYMASDIRRVSFILIAQKLGFSLREIRDQLALLPKGRTPTRADWTMMSENFSKILNAKIADLQRLKTKLDGCIGCGCLSLDVCSLYNCEDKAADEGPGPRYLLR